MDGVGGIHIMRRHLSASPTQLDMPPPWAPADRPAAAAPGEGLSLASAWHAVQQQLRALPELGRSVRRMLEAAKAHDRHHLTSPYSAPRSSLNQTVSAQRKTATLKLPLEQLHHLAQASRTSINDVLLCLCSGALRAYLLPKDSLPDEPLTAGVPVSLRANGDEKMGTAVSFMIANLATDVSCPAQRLREVHVSTRLAKQNLQGMSQLALNEYTLMLMAPMMLGLLARSSGRLRQPFNLIISNVPGPEEFLYYNGARLEEMYPFSIVTDGQALNITALSYAGHLHIGLTACAQTIPDLDSLAVAMHKEYSLLERLYRAASCPLLEAGTAAIAPG